MSQIKTNTTALQDILNAASNLPKPIDTSDATATSSKILSGYTAYVDNKMIAGNIPNKTGNDISVNGNTVNIPAGNYENDVLKSVGIATQATPSISVSSSGLITASANQDAGYVASGTKSSTKQLTTQAAKTITPGTLNQTAVSSRVYTTGAVTVKGDANLKAENILGGKSIFGVSGGIPNNGSVSQTIDGINTKSVTIPAGYTSGGTVSMDGTVDNAVTAALSALTEKGVEVPEGTNVTGLAALIAAIESGGGNISWGTFTLTSDTKDYIVTHDLGVVPDIFLFWMVNQKINGLTGNELFFGVNTSSSFKTLIGGSYSGASTIMTGNTTSSARYMTTLGSITSGGGSLTTLYGAPGSADATTIKLATSKESYFLCNGIIYVWVAIGGLS